MENGAGDNSARAVGMCDRLLTFLAKSLSMNRQKSIAEGPRTAHNSDNGNHAEEQAEEEDDDFTIQIEKAEFEYSHEEDRSSVATILEGGNIDVSTARTSEQEEENAEAAAEAPPVPERKVRKSVTIKEDKEEADKDAAAKRSLFKKRQPPSSELGVGGVEKPRKGLRPRMPAVLRVPSNINERSKTFIDERKKSFGKSEK